MTGGVGAGSSTPEPVKAHELAPTYLTGDVDLFTGRYSASYPLGSVSTPGGLGYSLLLQYSPTFVMNELPSSMQGIPYGEGWDLNLPTITVSVVYRKDMSDAQRIGVASQNCSDSDLDCETYDENVDPFNNGEGFWLSPWLSIPGGPSGRAVFKRFESSEAVFVLSEFENYTELRYTGTYWEVTTSDGKVYEFGGRPTIKMPSGDRTLYYDELNEYVEQPTGTGASVSREKILNSLRPRMHTGVWYCSEIRDPVHLPGDVIRFDYDQYGSFDFYKELSQTLYSQSMDAELELDLPVPYLGLSWPKVEGCQASYLRSISSATALGGIEKIELEYAVQDQVTGVWTALESEPDHVDLDDLYIKATVFDTDDPNTEFNGWHRYRHMRSNDVQAALQGCERFPLKSDPYRSIGSNGNERFRAAVPNGPSAIPIDHSILESPELLPTTALYPGDLYEIQAEFSGPTDNINYPWRMGNLDIEVWTESGNGYGNQTGFVDATWEDQPRQRLFSTFDRPVKWNMKGESASATTTTTTNLFMINSLRQDLLAGGALFDGLRVRIGPANSDNCFDMGPTDAASREKIGYATNNGGSAIWHPSAYKSYSHARWYDEGLNLSTNVHGKKAFGPLSHDPLAPSFGVGLPWSMLLNVHKRISGGGDYPDGDSPGSKEPRLASAFDFWWSAEDCDNIESWMNRPTLFDDAIKLERLAIVRYAKKPLALASVKKYVRHGEAGANPEQGWYLKESTAMHYGEEVQAQPLYWEQDNQGVGQMEYASSLPRRVVLLKSISVAPCDPSQDGLQDPMQIPVNEWPTTRFKYDKAVAFNDPGYIGLPTYYCSDGANDTDCPQTAGVAYTPFIDPFNPFIRDGVLLAEVVEPMGGITTIEYNDLRRRDLRHVTISSLKPTWVVTGQAGCDYDSYRLAPPDVQISPTVRRIRRSSEDGPASRTTDYEYEDKMSKPKGIVLGGHFTTEANGPGGSEMGFAKVTVLGPSKNGDRIKTVHHFRGEDFKTPWPVQFGCYGGSSGTITVEMEANAEWIAPTDTRLQDFLLFGKLWKTEIFNPDNELIERTIVDYTASLAYEHGMDRPSDSRVMFQAPLYDYFDYHPGFSPLPGEFEREPDHQAVSSTRAPWYRPRFLDYHVPDLPAHLASDVPYHELYRQSYFIKKTKEEHTVFDPSGCSLSGNSPGPVPPYPNSPGPLVNPGGTGVTNGATDANAAQLISALNAGGLTAQTKADLLAETPLSEAVLQKAIEKATTAQAANLKDVLHAETAMTNQRLEEVIQRPQATDPEKFLAVMRRQPYLADAVQSALLNYAQFSADEKKELLLDQVHLSNAVIEQLINGPSTLPAQQTYEVLLAQPDLPFSLLTEVLQSTTLSDAMKAGILVHQSGLGADVMQALITAAGTMDPDALEDILVHGKTYPNEADLIDLLTEVPGLPLTNLRNILLANPRDPSATLKNFIATGYPNAEVPGWANEWLEILGYCDKTCITEHLGIITVTEFQYYEADHTGTTSAEGYKRLMGLESTASFQLKWDPSWLLYSSKTHSPQYPDAHSIEEHFYYQDLKNRYDRTWSVLANTPGFEVVENEPEDIVAGISIPIVFKDFEEYEIPGIDAILRLEQFTTWRTNRSFQHRLRSKAPGSADEIIRSEYFYLNTRWNDQPDPTEILVDIPPPYDPCPPDWVSPPGNGNNGQGGNSGGPPSPGTYRMPGVNDDNWTDIVQNVPKDYVLVRSTAGGYYVLPISAWDDTDPDHEEVYRNVEGGGLRYLVVADLLKAALQTREVHTQADEVVQQAYEDAKSFGEELPLMDFVRVESQEPNVLDEWVPLLPFKSIRNKLVKERNPYQQVQLIENEKGLDTRFEFGPLTGRWYKAQAGYECLNYNTWELPHPGRPLAVIVGDGLPNEQRTEYSYNPDNSPASSTDPNGLVLDQDYDAFGRLFNAYRNGEKLATNQYEYWNNVENSQDTWLQRLLGNYAETITLGNIGSSAAVQSRAYADPSGRAVNSLSRIADATALSSPTDLMVSSGKVDYDDWDRPVTAYKPYLVTQGGGTFPFALDAAVLNNTPAHASGTILEDDHRSRPLFQSKPGEDINTGHRVKVRYQTLDCPAFACKLGLGAGELAMLAPTDPMDTRWLMTETEDEDGNISREYANALGQKVANQTFIDATTHAVTLFLYDDMGNVRLVINPEKQHTTYKYNLLGWMYQKETVDGGITKYMFDVSGNVVLEQDEDGDIPTAEWDNGGPGARVASYFRQYTYDEFNRLIAQDRVRCLEGNGSDYGELVTSPTFPMAYFDVLEGADPQGEPLSLTAPNNYYVAHYSSASTILEEGFARAKVMKMRDTYPLSPIAVVVDISDLLGEPIHEKAWFYDPEPQNNAVRGIPTVNLSPDIFNAIHNQRGGLLGRPSHTITWPHRSWDDAAIFQDPNTQEWDYINTEQPPVHYEFLSYNDEGQVAWQLQQFNHNGITSVALGNLARIDYPAYDLRGNLLTENVDVNSDFLLDVQYHYTYDDWGRLHQVYANFDDSQDQGNLLASYQYDDALGYLLSTTYHGNCTGGNAVVDYIEYSHDVRDRLTSLKGKFLDHYLYYDGANAAQNTGVAVAAGNYWNGRINAITSAYDLADATNDPGNFHYPTTYGYTYDHLGRLLIADGIQGDAAFGHQPNDDEFRVGDERYAFDRIGNFQWLQRNVLNGNGDVEKHAWDYDYATASNRLLRVLAQPGTQAPDRVYTYDDLGNLLSDDFRGLDHTTYGRANLPFHIAISAGGNNLHDQYLYNAADMRIHKLEVGGAVDVNDFYLRDAMGREIGVLNELGMDCEGISLADWQWYVFGTTRFARIRPSCTQQPVLYTSDLARNEQAAQELSFASLRSVLISLYDPATGTFPNNVTIYALDPPYNGQWYMTDGTYRTAVETVPHFEDEHHPQDITISGKNFQFSVPRAGLKENLVISVHEIIDMGPPNTRGGSTIWTYTFMADPTLPPVTYYEHDHLGNTRVTYTPVVTDCGGVGGPPSIDYTLEHVADYYPYGKILREYVNGVQDKYLTTHHERDQETGLDYRGARYYDSDVARFLSLDPLATKFAKWSAYNYVFSNPISLVDPSGMSATNYEDENGNHLGSDGIDNGATRTISAADWSSINADPKNEDGNVRAARLWTNSAPKRIDNHDKFISWSNRKNLWESLLSVEVKVSSNVNLVMPDHWYNPVRVSVENYTSYTFGKGPHTATVNNGKIEDVGIQGSMVPINISARPLGSCEVAYTSGTTTVSAGTTPWLGRTMGVSYSNGDYRTGSTLTVELNPKTLAVAATFIPAVRMASWTLRAARFLRIPIPTPAGL